jgi:hypothetical protein
VLSVFIPGLGQIYKGQIGKGILLLLLTIFGYMLLIVPGLALHLFTIIDAYSAPTAVQQVTPEEAARVRAAHEAAATKPTAEELEQRRVENRRGLRTLGLVIGILTVAAAAAIYFDPDQSFRYRTQSGKPGPGTETTEMTERRMIYNALLLGRPVADVAKRYNKSRSN